MNKHFFMFVAFVAFCLPIFSQTDTLSTQTDSINQTEEPLYVEPDYDFIRQSTADKSSPYYYPKLTKRFAQGDTTLDLADLQALYFGQVWQPDFNPYQQDPSIKEIVAILNDSLSSAKDYRRGIRIADEIINRHPANPTPYFYKFYCALFLLNDDPDTTLVDKTRLQFNMLLFPILSSGSGRSFDSPLHVVNMHDEYLILDMYRLEMTQQSLVFHNNHPFDVLSVYDEDGDTASVHFRIDYVYGWWGRNDDAKQSAADDKPTSKLTLSLGTRFDIEIVKTKSRNSKFRVVSLTPVNDTLIVKDSLFPANIPENHIIGYFCHTRLSASSDGVYISLLFKSNHKSHLEFDTFIHYIGADEDTPTSNSGIFPGVMHNELWQDRIDRLTISNIRR